MVATKHIECVVPQREPVLEKELQSLKLPTREFEWRSQIIRPEK